MKNLASVSVKNLSFSYNSEKEIFSNVSFKISPGEKVAIMGANGIGKTTLLNLINGEYEDFDGEILIAKGIRIGYGEQVIKDENLGFTIFEYFLNSQGLLETLSDYLALTELFEDGIKNVGNDGIVPEHSLPERSMRSLQENNLNQLLSSFKSWNQKQIVEPIFVDEETALEILEELEELKITDRYVSKKHLNIIDRDVSEKRLYEREFLNQTEKFLYKSKDSSEQACLFTTADDFLKHFKPYFEYLVEKSKFQNYFKENFYQEGLELLGELQEEYEKMGAYELERGIEEVLEIVNLKADDKNTKISVLSGGQKNKLILAKTIFLNPDILMLDEPTNNLDKKAYENLIEFVKKFNGTIICISHDPDFLEEFVDKVLYIDSFQKNIREYFGNYKNVEKEVEAQIERDRSRMNRIEKEIKFKESVLHKRAQQAEIYGSSKLAQNVKQLKKKVENLKESKGEVLKEDKVISRFTIPCTVPEEDLVQFFSVDYFEDGEEKNWNLDLSILKGSICLIYGKNGKGKTTFLKKFANKKADVWLHMDTEIGYYSQNFEELNPDWTVEQAMEDINGFDYQGLRSTLARFLFVKDEQMEIKVKELSEGQKALLALARLVFKKPNLLVLDEPTNHINFKHIPVIIESLKNYRGTILLVSHDKNFLKEMPISKVVDLDNKKVWKGEKFKKEVLN